MKREQGSVSVFAMMMMMLLSLIGTTLLTLSRTDLEITLAHQDGIAAQYVAEAGIQDAVTRLKTDPLLVEQTGRESYVTTSKTLGILPVHGRYTVMIEPDFITADQNDRRITAVGIVKQAQKRVMVKVTLPVPTSESNGFMITWTNKGSE